jgi:hypothetical protein
MGRILQIVVVSVCACLASVRPASAVGCGDGVVQAGEACDPGSGVGELACPGRCISQPNLEACQCATLSNDPRDFAVIADIQARLASDAAVTSGGVAVTATGGFLSVGSSASIAGESQAVADRCRLMPDSSVGRLFCNDDIVLPGAFIGDGGPFAFAPPATFPTLPPFTPGSGGGANVIVTANGTEYLAPGAYGNLIVEKGATLVLHGINAGSGAGRYDVLGIKVTDGGKLLADNPVIVNVKDSLRLTGGAMLIATPTTSVQPGDIQLRIEKKAKLGKGAFVQAHVRAPNGKITVGRGTLVVGQLIGSKVAIQRNAGVQAAGGCGDGTKQATETCDTSAASGDLACPGDCIVPGQAGQCTCRCATNGECNDGNACNGVETCDAGHCVLGVPPDCNDDNPCTDDCNAATGCVQVPKADGTRCEDGSECTRNDACAAGVCASGPARTCNDGNPCTADTCDPEHGCEHDALANGSACNDGNLCTAPDACVQGACSAGPAVGCDDANVCTVDSCAPAIGCANTPVANGTSCAGQSPCTQQDACVAGTCTPNGDLVCSDGNECTIDSCSPVGTPGSQTAACSHGNVPNGTPCGPAGADTCTNGVCG